MKQRHINNRRLLPDAGDTLGTTTGLISPPITDSINASARSPRPSFGRIKSPVDSSIALTALVLLTALFFMGFFSLYLRRFADSSSSSSSSRRRRRRGLSPPYSTYSSSSLPPIWRSSNYGNYYPRGLDPPAVGLLPLVSYGGDAKHPVDCVICLCEFEEGETVKMIPYCRHAFHPVCIDTWLGSHASCPLCRSSRIFGRTGEACAGVAQPRGEVDRGGGEGLGRSTVEIEEEEEEVGPVGTVRRARSYPSLGEHRAVLERSLSF